MSKFLKCPISYHEFFTFSLRPLSFLISVFEVLLSFLHRTRVSPLTLASHENEIEIMHPIQVIVSSFWLAIPLVTGWEIGQEVRTSSGWIKGHASSWQPAVSEYLGIPFAQPPVGSLRFTAPQAYRGGGKINADHFVSTMYLRLATLLIKLVAV
jgi:hypothetical protein